MARHRSVAVVLNTGGSPLDLAALGTLPRGEVVRAEVARGDRATCVAATVEHDEPADVWVGAVRLWASERGWLVTIAPLPRPQ